MYPGKLFYGLYYCPYQLFLCHNPLQLSPSPKSNQLLWTVNRVVNRLLGPTYLPQINRKSCLIMMIGRVDLKTNV